MTNNELACRVTEAFQQRGWTLAVAESCTGGRLGACITDIPGVSGVFLGGVIAYHNRIKHTLLDVPLALIEEFGAVSEPVAKAMAEGCRARFASTVSVSITGIAGPGGGTEEKPVGLVFLATSSPNGTRAEEFVFEGDREAVRESAVKTGLQMLLRSTGAAE